MPEAWAVSRRDPSRGLELARNADHLISGPESLVFRPLFRALHAELLMRADEHADAARALELGLEESATHGASVVDVELHRLRARVQRASGAPHDEVAAERARARAVGEHQEAVLFLDRLAADETSDEEAR